MAEAIVSPVREILGLGAWFDLDIILEVSTGIVHHTLNMLNKGIEPPNLSRDTSLLPRCIYAVDLLTRPRRSLWLSNYPFR